MTPADLHVISVISNPVRYRSRARLFHQNQAMQAAAGVTRYVAEATFGDRPPECADPANPNHFIVRCDHEVWLKEALLNMAADRLPAGAKFIMWQDADIEFLRADWASETLEALRHWAVVQPFSHAIDLGPDGEVLEKHNGFVFEWQKGSIPMDGRYPFMHPGFCWAWRREAWDQVGGMIDKALCGAGDHHMALALVGAAEKSLPGGVHPNYRAMVMDWQAKALRWIRRDIGHIPGTNPPLTVSGVGAGQTAPLSAAITGTATLYWIKNGVATTYGGSFAVADGDKIAWGVFCNTTAAGTVTVTSGGAAVGSFTYVVKNPGGGGYQ